MMKFAAGVVGRFAEGIAARLVAVLRGNAAPDNAPVSAA